MLTLLWEGEEEVYYLINKIVHNNELVSIVRMTKIKISVDLRFFNKYTLRLWKRSNKNVHDTAS